MKSIVDGDRDGDGEDDDYSQDEATGRGASPCPASSVSSLSARLCSPTDVVVRFSRRRAGSGSPLALSLSLCELQGEEKLCEIPGELVDGKRVDCAIERECSADRTREGLSPSSPPLQESPVPPSQALIEWNGAIAVEGVPAVRKVEEAND